VFADRAACLLRVRAIALIRHPGSASYAVGQPELPLAIGPMVGELASAPLAVVGRYLRTDRPPSAPTGRVTILYRLPDLTGLVSVSTRRSGPPTAAAALFSSSAIPYSHILPVRFCARTVDSPERR
jgi:hypothetical protein